MEFIVAGIILLVFISLLKASIEKSARKKRELIEVEKFERFYAEYKEKVEALAVSNILEGKKIVDKYKRDLLEEARNNPINFLRYYYNVYSKESLIGTTDIHLYHFPFSFKHGVNSDSELFIDNKFPDLGFFAKGYSLSKNEILKSLASEFRIILLKSLSNSQITAAFTQGDLRLNDFKEPGLAYFKNRYNNINKYYTWGPIKWLRDEKYFNPSAITRKLKSPSVTICIDRIGNSAKENPVEGLLVNRGINLEIFNKNTKEIPVKPFLINAVVRYAFNSLVTVLVAATSPFLLFLSRNASKIFYMGMLLIYLCIFALGLSGKSNNSSSYRGSNGFFSRNSSGWSSGENISSVFDSFSNFFQSSPGNAFESRDEDSSKSSNKSSTIIKELSEPAFLPAKVEKYDNSLPEVSRSHHTAPIELVKKSPTIDPAIIEDLLRLNIMQFKNCYQQSLDIAVDKSAYRGQLEIIFFISPDGKVSSSEVSSVEITSSKVHECMKNIIDGIQFPIPLYGKTVKVIQLMNLYPKK